MTSRLVRVEWLARISPTEIVAADGPSSNSVSQAVSSVHFQPTPSMFRVVWCGIVLVCFINAIFATTIAAVYYIGLVVRDGYMFEWMGLLPLNVIPIVLTLYVLAALYFWKVFFHVIILSIRQRSLTLLPTTPRPLLRRNSSWWAKSSFSVRRLLKRSWKVFFAIISRHELSERAFERLYLVREVVDVATQTYQAYICSTLISIAWVNQFYVGTLIVNCWITPFIHFATPTRADLRRFLYLSTDIILAFSNVDVAWGNHVYSAFLAPVGERERPSRVWCGGFQAFRQT